MIHLENLATVRILEEITLQNNRPDIYAVNTIKTEYEDVSYVMVGENKIPIEGKSPVMRKDKLKNYPTIWRTEKNNSCSPKC